MKRLLPLLLLAGCASNNAPETPQQACARQANYDPTVSALIMKGAGTEHFRLENQRQLHDARQDATLACLRARGLAPKGGVERPRP